MASDRVPRSEDTHAKYHCYLSETTIRRPRLAKSDLVAQTKYGTLTDRGYHRDPSRQKDLLHSPCHLPVKVIDVLRSTRIFPVIVMPASRTPGTPQQDARAKSIQWPGSASHVRRRSDIEMNMPGAVTGP